METRFWYVSATYLHLLGMALYVGGAFAMELVLGPAQRAIPPAQAQVMGEKTADRFLLVAWSSLGLLAVSGLLQLVAVGNEQILTSADLVDTSYGRTLLVMIVLWAVLVVNGSIITFVLRPRLKRRAGPQGAAGGTVAVQTQLMRTASRVQLISRIDLGIALFLPIVGAGLLRGGIF